MNAVMTCSTLALFLGLAFAMAGSAQTVNPSSYSMNNGELGPGGLLFRDDIYHGTGDPKQDRTALSGGLGQLSDGSTGCGDDLTVNCGSGPGYEWVGWHSAPTITFQFGQRCDFKVVRIFTANPAGPARLWKTATVSVSDDGLNFRQFMVRTTTPEEQRDGKARYIDIPFRASGHAVRIHLVPASAEAWTAISEVQFEGRTSRDQAPPSKPR